MKYLLTFLIICGVQSAGMSQDLFISGFVNTSTISQGGDYKVENNYSSRIGLGLRFTHVKRFAKFDIDSDIHLRWQPNRIKESTQFTDIFGLPLASTGFKQIEQNHYLGLSSLLKKQNGKLKYGIGFGIDYLIISKTSFRNLAIFRSPVVDNQYLRDFMVMLPSEINYDLYPLDLFLRYERSLNSRLALSSDGNKEYINSFQIGVSLQVRGGKPSN